MTELITLLAATDASLALRILRATRSRDIRNDLEEMNPARLRCLSSAHTALGRPILAQTLLQKAVGNDQ